jgi:hypothetical protein
VASAAEAVRSREASRSPPTPESSGAEGDFFPAARVEAVRYGPGAVTTVYKEHHFSNSAQAVSFNN